MSEAPAYFEAIRARAATRWVQLENDPELAGPWHQLFKQVQSSPWHVVSELLQNADDAGATKAAVDIRDGEFIFSHNGEDFTDEHFASLCRFGYSNKRALHTIGFRGIGFKSTFGLGDEVRLLTPTLAVRFRRERFTEPLWIDAVHKHPLLTEVRVNIRDEHCHRELKKNLNEWLRNPVSLLFLRHIRSLRISDQEVRWLSQGAGPTSESEWMSLSNAPDRKYLLIKSTPENFPPDALEEIKQERMLSVDEETSFPPSSVEIILGLEGPLFVILPTGIKTALPFACNAPFVQDPARVRVKNPSISPTNRWLLRRAGELAATTMLAWLRDDNLTVEERSRAYDLLPDVDRDDDSLEGSCAAIVEKAFDDRIENEKFLLTEPGSLESWKGCTAVPEILLEVWTPKQVSTFFTDKLPVLSRHVVARNRRKLIHWGGVQELDSSNAISVLTSKHLPKPDSWWQLMALWSYLSNVTVHHYRRNYKNVRVVPVQGKNVLYAANEVVRFGEKKLLQSQEDWQFLAERLLVLNQNWLRFLAKQRRTAEERDDESLDEQVEKAYRVLKAFGLTEASDVSRVIQRVADSFFAQDECDIEDCIRLAQLAACLGASVTDRFQFVTRSGNCTPVSHDIVDDVHNDLDTFVSDDWCEGQVLHEDYRVTLSCTKEEWRQWIASGRSRLLTFVPIRQTQRHVWGRHNLQRSLRDRGFDHEPYFPYVTHEFIIGDWDFADDHWRYWRALAQEDETFWNRLLSRILEQPQGFWSKALSAKALQVATTGNTRAITTEPLLPSWIVKFRELPCLQDTRGNYRQPAELFRRTPETEALLDVEPFVLAELDTEANRQFLLRLGVRDTPTGPDRLLDRLRALATVDNPPVYEVEKWYHRLDQLIVKCSTEEFEEIKNVFAHEKIILTEDNGWACVAEVFLTADEEDVPGAALVHSSVRHLTLWHKVGIKDRPTADLAIQWLAGLESGLSLSQDELRRVRSLLPRYPKRIWSECGHWLNLEGEWTPVEHLAYSLTMQSLVPWKHLFKTVKQKTADLQKLSAEVCTQYPFSELRSLAGIIEDRLQYNPHGLPDPEKMPWIIALGTGLRRIVLDDQDETKRVHELANRLASTGWQVVTGLQTVPYINGEPAGTSRCIAVLWENSLLYVENRSTAKMANAIAQELGRVFNKHEIADAIKLCYDRSPQFIEEYLKENFNLKSEEDVDLIDGNLKRELGQDGTATKGDTGQNVSTPKDANDKPGVEDVVEHSNAKGKDEKEEPARPRRKPTKSPKPSLIERFAEAKGYVQDGADRFCHPKGGCIQKVSGQSFPWERRSASGELLECYWPKEHCIQREPLELDAEIWRLCDKYPDKYRLLLVDVKSSPLEISGRQLREMCDARELTLFPAKYRLVYENKPSINDGRD